MQHSSIISILHISDFHFTRRRHHDQEVVVKALESDLQSICIGHRRPDIVLFTGDLVLAGGTDSHDEAYDFLLAKISIATGCSDERIFIVPGNHDVSRTIVENSADLHNQWRAKADVQSQLNEWYQQNIFNEVVTKKFDNYYELEKYLCSNSPVHKNIFVSVYRISELNTEIVIINTAALSAGGLESFGNDTGRLGVPEHALLDGLKVLTPGSYRIFCTHHPLSMMAESTSRH